MRLHRLFLKIILLIGIASWLIACGGGGSGDDGGGSTSPPITYAIGDKGPAGGIVFYVTDGGLRGLEAAPADQSAGAPWGCPGTDIAGAEGTIVGTGAQNTIDILAGCAELGIAARLADSYTLNGFSDWFLPSKDELNELYLQKAVVGGFTIFAYWSSSEVDAIYAWAHIFDNGKQDSVDKAVPALGVRAVRAF
jgi:hypothetical protein